MERFPMACLHFASFVPESSNLTLKTMPLIPALAPPCTNLTFHFSGTFVSMIIIKQN